MTDCSTSRYHWTDPRCAHGTQEPAIVVSSTGFRLPAEPGSPRISRLASRATSAVGSRGWAPSSRASTSTTFRRSLCRRCSPTGAFGWSAPRPTRRRASVVCVWASWEFSRFRCDPVHPARRGTPRAAISIGRSRDALTESIFGIAVPNPGRRSDTNRGARVDLLAANHRIGRTTAPTLVASSAISTNSPPLSIVAGTTPLRECPERVALRRARSAEMPDGSP